MTKIILDKWEYDKLINIRNDFDKVIDEVRWLLKEQYEEDLYNYKQWTNIVCWSLWIIAVLEFIILITR